MHPIAVAKIVCNEIGLGSTSICAALLHDVVEDTDYTVEDIENIFGAKIAQIVDGLTKISGGIFGDRASAQAENFKKLLLTMSDDIRVILIKIADRLHNALQKSPAVSRPDHDKDGHDKSGVQDNGNDIHSSDPSSEEVCAGAEEALSVSPDARESWSSMLLLMV